jgi:hypothetical protein
MADGSTAITNGFQNVFGESFVRLMCYFHLTKAVDTHIRSFDAKTRSELKSDITLLQLAGGHDEFDVAANLLTKKFG